jgi:hypothetical protein
MQEPCQSGKKTQKAYKINLQASLPVISAMVQFHS